MVIFFKTFYCKISRAPSSNDSLFYRACDSSLNFRLHFLPHRSHAHHRFILLSLPPALPPAITRTRERSISFPPADMNADTTVVALLLLAVGSCRGLRRHHVDRVAAEETELVAQPSKFGSLWPLPQKVQIAAVSFKLTGSAFRIVDAKQSSAGPSCNLLQDAYRRCRTLGF